MKERAAEIFPFAIAVVLPPAGLVLGLFAMENDRGLGTRICGAAIAGAVLWAVVLLSV